MALKAATKPGRLDLFKAPNFERLERRVEALSSGRASEAWISRCALKPTLPESERDAGPNPEAAGGWFMRGISRFDGALGKDEETCQAWRIISCPNASPSLDSSSCPMRHPQTSKRAASTSSLAGGHLQEAQQSTEASIHESTSRKQRMWSRSHRPSRRPKDELLEILSQAKRPQAFGKQGLQ